MEPILDIPAPEAGDSETVVSSLETAAVFGAKGDGAEALRWLQRAAESAGEGGDDARMLALARTVASLTSRLSGAPGPAEQPSAEGDEKPFLLESRSRPPPPSSRPTGTPPPPPSSRAHGSSPMAAEKPVAPSAASKSVTPSPPVTGTAPFRSVSPGMRASAAPTPRPSSVPPHLPKSNGASPTNGSRPAAKSVTPSVLGAPPAAATAPKSPDAAESPAAAPTGRRARQAARVSVTRSLTERGLYFVRVLDEDQNVPDDAFEGLLVSNDPNQSLV
jgi:hypothetical protein